MSLNCMKSADTLAKIQVGDYFDNSEVEIEILGRCMPTPRVTSAFTLHNSLMYATVCAGE